MKKNIYLFLVILLTNLVANALSPQELLVKFKEEEIKKAYALKDANNLQAKIEGTVKQDDKTIPKLLINEIRADSKPEIASNIKAHYDATATIFVRDNDEFIRVVTSVEKARGTKLDHNAAYEKVIKGEKFCGEVIILGNPYDTCYEPIKDSSNKVIGIVYVGNKK